MSNKFRKVLAAVLAGTMVLGSGVVANAAEGSGEGSGSLDVVEATDVFNVVLPTDAGDQFNYILDPTGIIAETDAAKYGSAFFEPGKTMYFRQEPASGSDVATYSDVSDSIKAYNKSTMDVEIKVQAKLATPSGIDIVTSAPAGGGAANTATPSIYLALKDAAGETAVTTAGIVATSSITDASALYEVVYATDSKTYKKQLNATASNAKLEDDFDGLFQSYSFSLTGSCNADGKWVGLTEEPPTVSLVWTIDKPDDASEVTDGPSITFDNVDLITFKGLTATKNYKASSITAGSDEFSLDKYDPHRTWVKDNYSDTTGGDLGVRIDDTWKNLIKERGAGKATVKLTLTDNSVITKEITVQ